MKKATILFIEQFDDGEELRKDISLYENEADAVKALKDFVDDERGYIKENHEEWVIEKDTEMEFEAYSDGYYSTDHTYAYVKTMELK